MRRHVEALVMLVALVAPATAKPRLDPALLQIETMRGIRSVHVFLGGKKLTAIDVPPNGKLEVELPGTGLRELRLEYHRDDGSIEPDDGVLVALGPGITLKAIPAWGVRIVAQPEGARCGAVSGHRGDWYACDGRSLLPTRVRFMLVCAAPVAMASEHYYYLERANRESVVSKRFLPTLPGLYRAHFAKGRISISYKPDDCASARDVPSY
ncbi:MAG: hypothetical protein HOV81_19580 [Kofleriaceae bacterium]|nr:hypothetical protein [Kofleriaceae bacterium]